MLNLHIGLPGIVPNLLHSLDTERVLASNGAPHIISRKLWQEKFRNIINLKPKGTIDGAASWLKEDADLKPILFASRISASQNALLGTAEECFLKSKTLPHAEARIKRLSEIFHEKPTTLHLTLRNQFDYLKDVYSKSNNKAELRNIRLAPSWYELVRRIVPAKKNIDLVVWDFDRPEKVILPFMICLLDTVDDRHIEKIYKHLNKNTKLWALDSNVTYPEEIGGMANDLDLEYDNDLKKIKELEGISLILPENIPSELHL